MSAVTSASLCWVLLSVCLLSVSADQKNIIAVPGQTVTLPCRAPNNNYPVLVVEWSRADLETEYVLFYRDEKLDPEEQHPSFKDRVDLQDRRMKDGDASLVLKDVTVNDTGTYECRVVQRGTNRRTRASLDGDSISTIYLSVVAPEQKNITAKSGQNVTLTCRVPNHILIPGVEWSRRDLETQYVLWYWEKQFVPYYQHPSFKNRVDLQDRQMKDGDLSLVLNNVTTADNGTYECCVSQEVRDGRRSIVFKSEPISIIHLKVLSPGSGGTTEDGGKRDGFIGLLVFLVLSSVSCAILIKYMKKTERTKAEAEKSSTPPPSSKSKRSVRPSHSVFRGRKTEVVKTDRRSR